jgi:hypothetical protein
MRRFHFSVDDVIRAPLMVSDWDLPVEGAPMLAFLARLHADWGVRSDLYCFLEMVEADGRRRSLAGLTPAACARLGAAEAFAWGPHAQDYATAPHAQDVEAARATFTALGAALDRIGGARAPWVRLHYFSELFELAPLWAAQGIAALMTTDRPARAWRLDEGARAALAARGRARAEGMEFVTSHIRLEFCAPDRPAHLCARIDAAVEAHGFCTLFTHEVELDRPEMRALLQAACAHAARTGLV